MCGNQRLGSATARGYVGISPPPGVAPAPAPRPALSRRSKRGLTGAPVLLANLLVARVIAEACGG